MKIFAQTPAEILDYGVDWARWLAAHTGGDTVTGSTWTVAAGLTVVAHDHDLSGTRAFLAAAAEAVPGQQYLATNRITTLGGRTAERTLAVTLVPMRYV